MNKEYSWNYQSLTAAVSEMSEEGRAYIDGVRKLSANMPAGYSTDSPEFRGLHGLWVAVAPVEKLAIQFLGNIGWFEPNGMWNEAN